MRNPFRRKTRIGAAIVVLTVVFVVAYGLLRNTETSSDVERRVLTTLETTRPGTFVPLARMIDGAYDHACVLGAYAWHIRYRPDVDRLVNTYMDEIKFQGDEGDWHIVLTQGDRVTILNFRRSPTVDVTWKPPPNPQQLPPGFTAARCAPFPGFGLFKPDVGKFVPGSE